jgi:hypothetical protein
MSAESFSDLATELEAHAGNPNLWQVDTALLRRAAAARRSAESARDAERLTTRAVAVRRGLHDLQPYWSPDTDSDHDPLDERETRQAVRSTLAELCRSGFLAARRSPTPPPTTEGPCPPA